MNIVPYFCISLLLLSTSLGYLQLAIDQPVELADAEKYHQQKVKVRGFLYRNKENELILANRPDLKTANWFPSFN